MRLQCVAKCNTIGTFARTHAFRLSLQEFALYCAPLTRTGQFQRLLRWLVRRVKNKASGGSASVSSPACKDTSLFSNLDPSVCAICYLEELSKRDPLADAFTDGMSSGAAGIPSDAVLLVNACIANCGHSYCYYCIRRECAKAASKATLKADCFWHCLRCLQPVEHISLL